MQPPRFTCLRIHEALDGRKTLSRFWYYALSSGVLLAAAVQPASVRFVDTEMFHRRASAYQRIHLKVFDRSTPLVQQRRGHKNMRLHSYMRVHNANVAVHRYSSSER